MSDQEATGAAPPVCAVGVPPEDVAAWALDGVESEVTALVRHVPDCPACRAVVADVSASRGVADTLRSAPSPDAPARVTQRAVGRIRTEATLLTLVRALGGGWLRVVQAFADYATPVDRPHPGLTDGLPDTGELPPLTPPTGRPPPR